MHTQLPVFAYLVRLYPLQSSLGALVANDNERTTELVERKRWSTAHSCCTAIVASFSHVEDHVHSIGANARRYGKLGGAGLGTCLESDVMWNIYKQGNINFTPKYNSTMSHMQTTIYVSFFGICSACRSVELVAYMPCKKDTKMFNILKSTIYYKFQPTTLGSSNT